MRTRSLPIVAADEEPVPVSQWYAVCRAEALKGSALRLRRLGRELILWRDGRGMARAADAQCPHRGADLGQGSLVRGEIVCPYHGFRFDGSGACTRMPCEGRDARAPAALRLSMHTVREEAGFLWLWHGRTPDEPPRSDLPWVPGAPLPEAGSAVGELVWRVRFSRVMEGMLDMHHVPFAHRYVSPPGYTRLDPYEVTVEGSVVRTRGTLRREDAPAARGLAVEINVAYPGMIHLRFFDRLQGVAVCTPIDGEHTWIALRYAQRFVRVPGLRKLLAWLLVQGELRIVQPDDLRILRATQPRTAGLRGSVLVRADRGVAAWHKLHARALAASGLAPAPASGGTSERIPPGVTPEQTSG